jgi:hypothetical protein
MSLHSHSLALTPVLLICCCHLLVFNFKFAYFNLSGHRDLYIKEVKKKKSCNTQEEGILYKNSLTRLESKEKQ